MRFFVSGATGYIGTALTRHLLDAGHEVHALCRTKPPVEIGEHPRLHIFQGNLKDESSVRRGMAGCEGVFHVGAYARVWAPKPETFFSVNVRGTHHVLKAARDEHVRRVVFTSTGGTFGVSNGKPITESMPRTVDFFSEYESSKFIAEETVQHFVRDGLDVVIVHPCRVYGPGKWTESNAVSYLIKQYITGRWRIRPGNGEALSSFSFIEDVVDGHLLAFEHGRSGEKYVLGGENISFNRFMEIVAHVSGKRYSLISLPESLMMLFAWEEEVLAHTFGKKPLVTRKWIKKFGHHMAFSSDKAVRELGYHITPIETGIARTVEWLRQTQSIHN